MSYTVSEVEGRKKDCAKWRVREKREGCMLARRLEGLREVMHGVQNSSGRRAHCVVGDGSEGQHFGGGEGKAPR
jgi:hypothetical protein